MSLLQILVFVINAVIAAHCKQFQIPLLVSRMLLESNEKWHRHQLQPQHHNAAEWCALQRRGAKTRSLNATHAMPQRRVCSLRLPVRGGSCPNCREASEANVWDTTQNQKQMWMKNKIQQKFSKNIFNMNAHLSVAFTSALAMLCYGLLVTNTLTWQVVEDHILFWFFFYV